MRLVLSTKIVVAGLIVGIVTAGAATAASAAKAPTPTLAKANAAAAKEVFDTFPEFDPKLRQPGESAPTFRPGCRRLTKTTYRCDWNGTSGVYIASGTVRVTFARYGVDADLVPNWICAPRGELYKVGGVDLCP